MGLHQEQPIFTAKIRREQLFGNRLLTSSASQRWGHEKKSKFRIWMLKGIQTIGDFWSSTHQTWLTLANIQKITGV